MKLGNRMPVDVGIVLAAGAAMAPTTELVGSTLGATTLAAFSAPAAAAGAPEPIGDHSAPSPAVRVAERSVAEHSVPISAYSPPVHCEDIPMPGIVGSASALHCVVFRTPRDPRNRRDSRARGDRRPQRAPGRSRRRLQRPALRRDRGPDHDDAALL